MAIGVAGGYGCDKEKAICHTHELFTILLLHDLRTQISDGIDYP